MNKLSSPNYRERPGYTCVCAPFCQHPTCWAAAGRRPSSNDSAEISSKSDSPNKAPIRQPSVNRILTDGPAPTPAVSSPLRQDRRQKGRPAIEPNLERFVSFADIAPSSMLNYTPGLPIIFFFRMLVELYIIFIKIILVY